MKKKALSIAFAFPFVICMAIALADLTGTWKGTVSYNGTPLDLTYKLKADGTVLTGSVTSSYGELPLTDGKISGSDFSYKVDIGNGPVESKGKYYGDSIVVVSGFSGESTTFKRAAQ